jgi:hypothetical protein
MEICTRRSPGTEMSGCTQLAKNLEKERTRVEEERRGRRRKRDRERGKGGRGEKVEEEAAKGAGGRR